MKTFAVMRRDLLKLMRNPLTLLSTILMPIIYLVIIGNSFQGQLKHLPVAVVAQDHGEYARRVVEQMLALQAGPKTVEITFMANPGEAIADVRNGEYKGAIIIPPNFSHDVAEGRLAEIGLFTDNVDSVSAATLEAVMSEAAAAIKITRPPGLDTLPLRSEVEEFILARQAR